VHWSGYDTTALDIEVDPQRCRFGSRKSDFALQALVECRTLQRKLGRKPRTETEFPMANFLNRDLNRDLEALVTRVQCVCVYYCRTYHKAVCGGGRGTVKDMCYEELQWQPLG
jgi:hypothetical protein